MISRIRAAIILLMIGGVVFFAVDYASKVAGSMYRKGGHYLKYQHGEAGKNVEQDLTALLQGKGLSEDAQLKAAEKAYIYQQTRTSFFWIFVVLFVGGMLLLVFKEQKVDTEEESDRLFQPPSVVKSDSPDSWEEDLTDMEDDLFKQAAKKKEEF
jgi:hypothetical protein